MSNVFFDTCVYHQPGIDLLTGVIGPDNILFASEMLGAVRGDNPDSGFAWDDTKQLHRRVALSDEATAPRCSSSTRAASTRACRTSPGSTMPDESQVPELRDAVARACRILAMEGVVGRPGPASA